jgi:phosphoenolpyruvate carboxykinase (ATP)
MNMELEFLPKDLNSGYKQIYHRNLSVSELINKAICNCEGKLTASGAFNLVTGKYTGRSPRDKFIVDSDEIHNDINWGSINTPIKEDSFDKIYARLSAYLENKELYIFDGFAGADNRYSMQTRFINEYAAHNLFVHQLFIRPTEKQLENFEPDFTVICAPGFKANIETDMTNSETFIIANFHKRVVIIGGTGYCGEMKKAIFSVMNYLLPKKNILPMHCSANIGIKGDTALFFGLSGTGKTTLSADPFRELVGDDEHGWSEDGIFNFEGGCYAKCINLSKDNEPQIWDAIRFGTVLENVVVDDNGIENFNDSSLTENTRAGYPIDYIHGASTKGVSGHPRVILFLTADAYGVLPPISKLNADQAMYHFMSGYTSKLAGTERGIKEPEATFSECFGAPFMPMNPIVYAKMLGERIHKHEVNVYLVNTGWTGGAYSVGSRIKLSYTRAMVTAAINEDLENVVYEADPIFKFLIPKSCPGVPDEILMPSTTWKCMEQYIEAANELANKFVRNFEKFDSVPEEIKNAGPEVLNLCSCAFS